MHVRSAVVILTAWLTVGCAAQPAPTPIPPTPDVAATVVAMVQATMTAAPTRTPLPTATAQPSPTPNATAAYYEAQLAAALLASLRQSAATAIPPPTPRTPSGFTGAPLSPAESAYFDTIQAALGSVSASLQKTSALLASARLDDASWRSQYRTAVGELRDSVRKVDAAQPSPRFQQVHAILLEMFTQFSAGAEEFAKVLDARSSADAQAAADAAMVKINGAFKATDRFEQAIRDVR